MAAGLGTALGTDLGLAAGLGTALGTALGLGKIPELGTEVGDVELRKQYRRLVLLCSRNSFFCRLRSRLS